MYKRINAVAIAPMGCCILEIELHVNQNDIVLQVWGQIVLDYDGRLPTTREWPQPNPNDADGVDGTDREELSLASTAGDKDPCFAGREAL